MNNLFTAFLDRLVGRLATLVAGLVSSRVEGFHAAAQADQQSQLEDLARVYESNGKLEIAATLRQRAARLTSANLASEAVEIVDLLTDERTAASSPKTALPPSGPQTLGDFRVSSPAAGKRRKKADADRKSDDAGDGK